jgi:hypothetical protein
MNRPMDKLVGEFEAQLIGRVTNSTLYGYSRVLTEFFDAYPNKTSPREFTINHVEDWKAAQEKRYSFYGVRCRLQYLKAFFNWFQREKDTECSNPVSTREIEKEMWRRRVAKGPKPVVQ